MAKIMPIAISTQEPAKTAQFDKELFGLKEVAKIDSPGATGFHLTSKINFAVLKFKNDQPPACRRATNPAARTLSASRSTAS